MSSRFAEAFLLRYGGSTGVEQSPPAILDGGAGQLAAGQVSQGAIGAAFITVPCWVRDLDAWSLQITTGAGSTFVGTASIQVSNDRGGQEQTGNPDVNVANWVTINIWDWSAGAQAANKAIATGAASYLIGDRVAGYRWMRLNMAYTSGSGLIRCMLQQKGVS